MDYCVTFKIEGRYVAGVKANSVEEAIELARDQYCDADFGELTDIEGEEIIVEDEKGNFVWEHP